MIKKLPQYPGYSISDDGKVYSHFNYIRDKEGKIMDRVIDYSFIKEMKSSLVKEKGRSQIRPCVTLRINRKRVKVFIHKLVALAFIPNPHKYPEVRHLNDIATDNRVSNLMWGTSQVNARDRQQNQNKDLLIKQLKQRIEELEKGVNI